MFTLMLLCLGARLALIRARKCNNIRVLACSRRIFKILEVSFIPGVLYSGSLIDPLLSRVPDQGAFVCYNRLCSLTVHLDTCMSGAMHKHSESKWTQTIAGAR